MPRPRHPDKDLEAVLRQAERLGWIVVRGKTYYKLKCGCPLKHARTMHITPSNPHYRLNWLKQTQRATCWPREGSS